MNQAHIAAVQAAMYLPSARIILSCDGAPVTVYPGNLIGRLAEASVMIADPRISEAHALVSLRSRSLRLLALRGALTVAGREVDEVTLEAGLQVELADGLSLTVESVEVPTHSLTLCGASPGPVRLGASTYSLVPVEGPGPRRLCLLTGYVPDAPCHLWQSGARLWVRAAGGDAEPIQAGKKWAVEGCVLQVVQMLFDGTLDTEIDKPRVAIERTSLVVVARYATVHLHRDAGTAVIAGRPANLISELVAFNGKPIPWETLARQIWSDEVDRERLRDRFDTTCSRLRRQLRDLAIREDLVRLDGSGNTELVLYPGDRMIDES